MRDHPRPFDRPGVFKRAIPFIITAYIAIGSLLLSDITIVPAYFWSGVILLIILTFCVFMVPWNRLPDAAQPLIPYGFIIDTLLLNSGTNGVAGIGVISLLSIIWLALYGVPIEVVTAIFLIALRYYLPIPLDLPSAPIPIGSQYRAAILFTTVAALIGSTVNRLVWILRDSQAAEAMAKAALQDTNRNLAISNADLASFASAAAHDLRSPLRTMTGFAGLLRDKYGDRLDEEGNDYLNRIVSGGDRLSTLITDLISFARVGKGENPEWIALNEKFRHVLVLLDPDNRVQVQKGLPKVYASRTALFEAFQSIIENSLKYVRQGAVPIVKVTGRRVIGGYELIIADNGIGIDKAYRERIFEPFKRLHTQTEYPGTGLGLAVAKRAIESVNGTIRADANRPRGTRMIIFLPDDVIDDE